MTASVKLIKKLFMYLLTINVCRATQSNDQPAKPAIVFLLKKDCVANEKSVLMKAFVTAIRQQLRCLPLYIFFVGAGIRRFADVR